mgnify:CR=1 FL=1|tara:strand:- start:423 stop:854 length:432 start_codon:yes stop_codon:yes gene_type:complete
MSTSKFSNPFMMKSPLSPLEGNAFIKAKMDAEAAGKSSFSVDGKNYPLKMEEESPLNIDPEKKKAYQDSIQKLHKPAYDKYVKRSKEGFEISDDDGQTMTKVAPRKPEDIKSLKEYAYTMEIGKGGSVKKDGVAASKLARTYK